MTGLNKNDIGRLPPIDKSGEIEKAGALLKRFRKAIGEIGIDWQYWVAESLLAGLPPRDEDEGAVS